jgi:antitoxin (DNA-binding transcriptional repressor) of toxin-antitoxin stability system
VLGSICPICWERHVWTTHFPLIERVARSEEITIARYGSPVAKLMALPPAIDRRVPGFARGIVDVGSDFDASIPEGMLDALPS